MSYELWTRRSQEPVKMKTICPEYGTKMRCFGPPYQQTYRVPGIAGISSSRTDRKNERVEGTCKECKYKFKTEYLE